MKPQGEWTIYRLAILVWIEFSVYGGKIECCGRVLHILIGRYVFGVGSGKSKDLPLVLYKLPFRVL